MTTKDEQLLRTLAKLMGDVQRYGERNATDAYHGQWEQWTADQAYHGQWEQWTADQDEVQGWIRGICAIVGKIERRSMLRLAEKLFRIED